ncbi:MAG: hypothetical protein ACXVBW_08595, partial [Bdellovibrionota bacterium]
MKNLKITPASPAAAVLRALVLAVVLTACNNSRMSSKAITGVSGATGAPASGSTASTTDNFVITSAGTTAASGGAANAVPNVNILIDPTKSTAAAGGQPALTNHCTVGGGGAQTAKPCVCKFSWQEINQTGGSVVPITRAVSTGVSIIQAALATCPAPSEFATIVDST